MSNISTFRNPAFGSVRAVSIDNEPYFVGKDVAEILGYERPTDAVRKRVDPDDRGVAKMETPSGAQEMTIINESGLYSLILSSKLPKAKEFKRWVTSEVLPAIRTAGQYSLVPADDVIAPMVVPDAKDYLTAARLIASCPKDRMRMVLSFLEKGGFDVSTVREDFKSKTTADMSEIITETVERTGYSCEQIGKLIGVKGNTLTSYVRKDRFPRPERYREIVMALNLL